MWHEIVQIMPSVAEIKGMGQGYNLPSSGGWGGGGDEGVLEGFTVSQWPLYSRSAQAFEGGMT